MTTPWPPSSYSGRESIAVTIITRDEEANLRDLLPRLAWADEIVVVDSGSTDRTVAVAEAHGCRVAYRAFDDFASQRNYAWSLATCQWVLSLDADERPSPPMEAALRRLGRHTRQAGFRIAIRSTLLGRRFRWSGTQDDRRIRLARRSRSVWDGNVHEVLRVQGRVADLPGWIEHHSIPTWEALTGKIDRYTRLEAQRLCAQGARPRFAQQWTRPPLEVFRRLLWKGGLLDGPAGWGFAFLSGYSEWVLRSRHARLWRSRHAPSDTRPAQQFPHGSSIAPSDLASIAE